MGHLPTFLLLLATLAVPVAAVAAGPTQVEAERIANGLRQGMPLDDVRKLLGNPGRASVRTDGNSTSEATRSTLQWTYSWPETPGAGTLRVEFASKQPEKWTVTKWTWANY